MTASSLLGRGFTAVEAAGSTELGAEMAEGPAGERCIDPAWRLLARVGEGDAGAFTELVELYQERLLRLADRLLGDPEEARDAVQEVLLKTWRKAASVRPRGQVYTWLYRVAVNHCLNRLRRRRIVRFLHLEAHGEEGGEGGGFALPDPAADPEQSLALRRRWRATRRAIAALPPNQRAVLVLARFEGLSYKEISRVLGTSVGAVESRLFRAMRNLEAAGVAQEEGS